MEIQAVDIVLIRLKYVFKKEKKKYVYIYIHTISCDLRRVRKNFVRICIGQI